MKLMRRNSSDNFYIDRSTLIEYDSYIGDPTKSAMQSVRVKLSEYQALGIDLSAITEIIIQFPDTSVGKISIDNILITN